MYIFLQGASSDRMCEIRTLVQQLYTSLNASEHTAKLEMEFENELENLKKQLEPMEKVI